MKRSNLGPTLRRNPRAIALLFGFIGWGWPSLPAQAPSPATSSVVAGPQALLETVSRGDLPATIEMLAADPATWSDATNRQVLLIHACREGWPDLVQWMLENGASPDREINRETPLDAAAGWTAKIFRDRLANPEYQKLVELGTSPAKVLKPEQTKAFNLESWKSHFVPMPPDILARKAEVIAILIKALGPAGDVARLGSCANRIVTEAIQSGFGPEVIEELARAGASTSAGSGSLKITPLHTAVMIGNREVAAALIALGADLENLTAPLNSVGGGTRVGRGGNTPLMTAITFRQPALVRLLLEKGANVEASNAAMGRALHFAAGLGDPEILGLILGRHPRVNVRDRWQCTPLHYAAGLGHLEASKLLVAAGADLEAADEAGFTPLLNAAERDQLDILKYLLEQGASRRARTDIGKGPLRVAATSNALAVASHLIAIGEKVDGDDSDTMRPLHEAASSGHPAMVALLLENGAKTEVRDRALRGTPLLGAVMAHSEILRQRLAARANELKSSYGVVSKPGPQYLEIIRLLSAHGADLNTMDRGGNTPLHYAVELRDRETVELLHELRARHDLLNNAQRTALDLALESNQPELAALLR